MSADDESPARIATPPPEARGDTPAPDTPRTDAAPEARAPATDGRPWRLLIVDEHAPAPLTPFLRAVRKDCIFVCHLRGAAVDDILAAVQAAHAKAGSVPLRSVALWQSEPETDAFDVDFSPRGDGTSADANARRRRAQRRVLRRNAKALLAGLAPLLERTGRVHVLTQGVLDTEGPLHLAEGSEVQFARELEEAAGGRPVAIGRGEPLEDAFQLVAIDREVVDVTHTYWEQQLLKSWQFARNRHNSGSDPNRLTAAGLHDVTDLRQSVMTYLKELPFLYSIMIGSFLMLFVPESCTSYAEVCSSKENLGTHTKFGEFVLFMNCATALCFVISDFFFNRREQWLIEWLDVDDEYPSTHLPHVLDRYPHIKTALRGQNMRCAALSSATALMVLANFVVSAAFVLRRVGHEEKVCCPGIFPGETKTITTLVTNTLLVFMKVLLHVRTTRRSLRESMGISSVHLLPLSYNMIDADHVDEDEEEPKAKKVSAAAL